MPCHVGILPTAVLETLMAKLDEDILEEELSQGGLRILRLLHPRTGIPALFLPYESPSKQSFILEVQVVSPPNPRTWFMSEGEVLNDGRLLIMTPIDPAFILLPVLHRTCPADGSSGNFCRAEDLLEEAVANMCPSNSAKDSSHASWSRDLLYLQSFGCIQSTMKRICDVKEITADITVYRYSPLKVQNYLQMKVARLAMPGVFETSLTLTRNLAKVGLMEDEKEALLQSARTRAACDLIAQYISEELYTALLTSYDFTALEAHLRAAEDETAALLATSANKVEIKELQNKDAAANEKKRKGSTKASHGVEKLKKANVKGMAKISSFFQKPAK
ncbi:hypothetical protein AcW1_009009 [Taiwanofungus camphoratus]|nr:hypothetical protein AcW1_009009 [Antrodia cinnamomea]